MRATELDPTPEPEPITEMDRDALPRAPGPDIAETVEGRTLAEDAGVEDKEADVFDCALLFISFISSSPSSSSSTDESEVRDDASDDLPFEEL